jgi:hypothetical protein
MAFILGLLNTLFRALPGAALLGIGVLLLRTHNPAQPTTALPASVLGVLLGLGGLWLLFVGVASTKPRP